MKKLLVIEDGGKFIHFKKRKIRTPVTLEVSDEELKFLKVSMRMADINKWYILDGKDRKVIRDSREKTDDPIIEDLSSKSMSLLEKLMKDGDDE